MNRLLKKKNHEFIYLMACIKYYVDNQKPLKTCLSFIKTCLQNLFKHSKNVICENDHIYIDDSTAKVIASNHVLHVYFYFYFCP